uniref:Uncharacterized protein n=1 Tax=Anopheles atroparvus TaxID=41427 RepID=A0AAG5DEH6_ANOAO
MYIASLTHPQVIDGRKVCRATNARPGSGTVFLLYRRPCCFEGFYAWYWVLVPGRAFECVIVS